MKQIMVLLALTLLTLSPGARANQFDDLSHASKLTYLLFVGASSINGAADGTEPPLGLFFHSDDVEQRYGQDLSHALNAGIKASEDPQLILLAQTCNAADGWVNRANCLKVGLARIDNRTFVNPKQARFIVKEMCGNAQMFADGARCLQATVPLIHDPELQNITAGCRAVRGGTAITNCYLKALEKSAQPSQPSQL